jgi:hypothetical protein
MGKNIRLRRCAAAFATIIASSAAAAVAVVPVHIVKTDIRPLIRAGATSPTQFAVQVPYAISTTNAGNWSVENGRATWHYAVRIPTAVSLSFYANQVKLPASAVLAVHGPATTVAYRGNDVHRAELWSRIQPGDTLEFSLSVLVAEQASTLLKIVSFQAGYRALGAGVQNHPYFRQLRLQTASTTNASCVQNYECHVTAADSPAGQATVGLVINNLYQCSGTLMNDIPQDNAPYVLTARHCETGTLGGGNPGAATTVTVYWDATSACGSALGALYDPSIKTQIGATTVVEQQDAWLLRLDESPVVSDAQLAGFDARGGAVQGGYTIHHALGFDKQFTSWSGTAFAVQESGVLGVNYVSNFWETVNATGNIGPGTSGGGLFDQNNVLVGSASLGRQAADSSGYESCPNPTPPQPNGSNGAADFTSLAAIWNSTADTTSSTLPATLKSILDPQNTGTLVASSLPAASMSFMASTYSLPVGAQVLLTWNAAGATQCTAGGGTAGDGWGGALGGASAQQVTEAVASIVTYTLSCALPGSRTVTAAVSVTWGSPQPEVSFLSTGIVWTTRPATLTWVSNVSPCSISGGSFSEAGLPSSGSVTTTQSTTGQVNYQIQCGSPTNYVMTGASIQYVTPGLQFLANGTDRLLGQPLQLSWLAYADTCTPSGGAANDGWTTTAFASPGNYPTFSPNVTTLGTYTYTLTCTSGPISIKKSITVTFDGGPAFVTATVQPTSVTYSHTPADIITLSWNSNLTQCIPATQPITGGFISNLQPQDTATWGPPGPGTYIFAVTCTAYNGIIGSVVSAPIVVTVLPPPPPTAVLSVAPTSVSAGQNFTLTWSSTNSDNCTATGAPPGDVSWNGGLSVTSGSYTVNSSLVGRYTFGLSCQSPDLTMPSATAQAIVTITPPVPTVTLSASPTSLQSGQAVTLTWSSTNATACLASGGGANGTPWSGNLTTSGSLVQTTTTAGAYTYTVTCSEGNLSAKAQAPVSVSAVPSDGGGGKSGGGGGGGGTFGVLELALLGAARTFRRRGHLKASATRSAPAVAP